MKYEGANPTGTQKDRIARLHARRAYRMGFEGMTVGTCGNYGAAIVKAAAECGIGARVYVPSGFHPQRLLSFGKKLDLARTNGFVEDAITISTAYAKDEGVYDANPGSVNADIDRIGYSRIAEEIVSQLGAAPDFIAVPVGNGTTLVGIYWGFKEMASRGLIDSVPRFVGVAPPGTNPIVESFLRGSAYVDLDPGKIAITEVNEPLAGYHSVDGAEALAAIRASRGLAVPVTEPEMALARGKIMSLSKVDVLPCSAAAVAAAWRLPPRSARNKSVVAIATGRPVA